MRASAAALAVSLAALFGGTVGHAAPAGSSCRGTLGNDVLMGTPRADVLCGLAGNDSIAGMGGNDRLLGGPGDDVLDGGPGSDTLIGGPGRDFMTGGPGSDRIDARDGVWDRVDCSREVDVAWVDRIDSVSNCETVHRT